MLYIGDGSDNGNVGKVGKIGKISNFGAVDDRVMLVKLIKN